MPVGKSYKRGKGKGKGEGTYEKAMRKKCWSGRRAPVPDSAFKISQLVGFRVLCCSKDLESSASIPKLDIWVETESQAQQKRFQPKTSSRSHPGY